MLESIAQSFDGTTSGNRVYHCKRVWQWRSCKEMIELAASESDMTEENVQQSEQNVSNLLLFNMVQDFEVPIIKSAAIIGDLYRQSK